VLLGVFHSVFQNLFFSVPTNDMFAPGRWINFGTFDDFTHGTYLLFELGIVFCYDGVPTRSVVRTQAMKRAKSARFRMKPPIEVVLLSINTFYETAEGLGAYHYPQLSDEPTGRLCSSEWKGMTGTTH
jgi:hypothetical protein